MKKSHLFICQTVSFAAIFMVLMAASCSNQKDNNSPAFAQYYVVFAWNDPGMHCLNPSYDKAVILPPCPVLPRFSMMLGLRETGSVVP